MSEEAKKIRIAKRAALELKDGDVVNLGVGLPTQVLQYLPQGVEIFLQSENGILGMGAPPEKGKETKTLIDASRKFVTLKHYGVVFDSATSFGMIRGGYIDATILGALEVDQYGNVANYKLPGKFGPGIGGGMDLIVGAKKVILAMTHITSDGKPKIVERCSLPLTAPSQANVVITDMAVLEVDYNNLEEGLVVKEILEDHTIDELVKNTGAKLNLKSYKNIK